MRVGDQRVERIMTVSVKEEKRVNKRLKITGELEIRMKMLSKRSACLGVNTVLGHLTSNSPVLVLLYSHYSLLPEMQPMT